MIEIKASFEVWCNECHSNDVGFELVRYESMDDYDISIECMSCGYEELLDFGEGE
ncbi:hypothetical protein MKY20_11455 [Cytobacillus sp. FSL W8-0315]|uniref:hypothetical protein n=1 Tax=Cytobacillus sp. FSL W8-0315 TaxID=2921600 RepID=UPI0030F80481